MQTTHVSADVYYAADPIVNVGAQDLQFLLNEVPGQAKQRVRLCAHRGTDDAMQEMFIAFTSESYLRPSLHLKDESLHVLSGRGTYLFFDDDGEVVDRIPLGEYGSDRAFYCRIPRDTYHALVVESDVLLIHEITEGPFNRADTVFAPWAPGENDVDGVVKYRPWLADAAAGKAPPR